MLIDFLKANLIFYNTYVEPEQNFLLRTLNELLVVNKYPELYILNSNPSTKGWKSLTTLLTTSFRLILSSLVATLPIRAR